MRHAAEHKVIFTPVDKPQSLSVCVQTFIYSFSHHADMFCVKASTCSCWICQTPSYTQCRNNVANTSCNKSLVTMPRGFVQGLTERERRQSCGEVIIPPKGFNIKIAQGINGSFKIYHRVGFLGFTKSVSRRPVYLRPYPASHCGEGKHLSIYAFLILLIPDSCVNPRNLPLRPPCFTSRH